VIACLRDTPLRIKVQPKRVINSKRCPFGIGQLVLVSECLHRLRRRITGVAEEPECEARIGDSPDDSDQDIGDSPDSNQDVEA